jgi:hypothetical protein
VQQRPVRRLRVARVVDEDHPGDRRAAESIEGEALGGFLLMAGGSYCLASARICQGERVTLPSNPSGGDMTKAAALAALLALAAAATLGRRPAASPRSPARREQGRPRSGSSTPRPADR